jgi:hypothetical protein
MNVIVVKGIRSREPTEILDFLWKKAEGVLATSPFGQPPMFFVFNEKSVTLFDVRAEFASQHGKNACAAMMHRLAADSETQAIAFVCEAFALMGAKDEDVEHARTHGAKNTPGNKEILYVSVETRAGTIGRLAEIVRDEVSIEFKNQQELFSCSAEARFGRFFAAGNA